MTNTQKFILFFYFLTIAMGVYAQPARTASKDSAYEWMAFNWYADSVNGKYYDKLAIFLPVKINGIDANFIAQLDIGASETIIYGNAIKNYFPSKNTLYSLLDTSKKASSDANIVSYPCEKIELRIGKTHISKPRFFENYGDEIPKDSCFTQTPKHIGSIGSDIVKNKVIIIDFPRQRLCIIDLLDNYWIKNSDFVSCRIKNNRIQLPIRIHGTVYWMMMDTGASIFPLSTNPSLWNNIVDLHKGVDTLTINSWGEKVAFYGANLRYPAYLGKHRLNNSMAWCNENKRLLEFNIQEGISGTTGNAYFFNNTVIIDFKNKRYGMLK